MPKRIDAALHIIVANQLLAKGDAVGGLTELAHAVETAPGLTDLIKFEEAIRRKQIPKLDLMNFIMAKQEFIEW